MYKILNANGLETPPYEVCDRDGAGGAGKKREGKERGGGGGRYEVDLLVLERGGGWGRECE